MLRGIGPFITSNFSYETCQVFGLHPLLPTPVLQQGVTHMSNPTPVQDFIRRWQASGAAERANFPNLPSNCATS